MKVKMLVHYQGYRNKGLFEPNKTYTVDAKLGEYLLAHKKAIEIKARKSKKPANKK